MCFDFPLRMQAVNFGATSVNTKTVIHGQSLVEAVYVESSIFRLTGNGKPKPKRTACIQSLSLTFF